jgi:hypothetical protein
MNDADLELKLRSVRVPGRPDEYWEDFPGRVRGQLRRERAESAPRHGWRIRFAWACEFALTMAVALVCLEYHPLRAASTALAKQDHYIHARLARLDASLHRLVLDTGGLGYLLSEAN